jgi:MFS family permease
LLGAAQLAPMLVLSIPGGAIAGKVQARKQYMISLQVMQIACALTLTLIALGTPSKWFVFLAVLGGGIANALSAPLYQSVLPELVGRENIPGAVSLGSAQVNGSRVIGPFVLALLASFMTVKPSAVFLFNAATFGFMIWALVNVNIAGPPPHREGDPEGMQRLLVGLREARANPVVARALGIMFVFSLASLGYIQQFPSIAEARLDLDSNSRTYMFMFGTWAFGALCGSLSMSTIFAAVDKAKVPRVTLIGVAAAMVTWSFLSSAGWATFLVLFALGFCYFATATALNTVLQQHLVSRNRPQVMSLWFMAFGGTVPLAAMWAGALMDSSLGHSRGAVVLLVFGAMAAAGLALASSFRPAEAIRR